MFESSAPKYKFGGAGGSNENVTASKKDDTTLRKTYETFFLILWKSISSLYESTKLIQYLG